MTRNISSIIWGLALIALGLVMLLDNMGYLEFDLGRFLSIWWPLIMIIIGLGLLFDRPRGKK